METNMTKITIPQMIEIVQFVAIDENEPVFIWGEPGCGKTEGIHSIPDVDVIDIRLSQYASVDFRGFPGVGADKTTIWHMPSTLPFIGNDRFDPDRKKLIFLDEANAALPAVTASAYQLVQEGRVGEHILMPNTFIVAAGNREGDRGITNRQPKPFSNRFTHYEARPDADSWCSWGSKQPRVPAELVAFIMFRKTMISTFDPDNTVEKAFATARTWMKVAKYHTNPNMPDDIKEASYVGSVGKGPATEFIGFLRLLRNSKDMPTVAQIIADPHGTPIPAVIDVQYAVMVSIAGDMNQKNAATLDIYLNRMQPDFRMACWQLAINRDETLLGSSGFVSLANTYNEIFAGALSSRR